MFFLSDRKFQAQQHDLVNMERTNAEKDLKIQQLEAQLEEKIVEANADAEKFEKAEADFKEETAENAKLISQENMRAQTELKKAEMKVRELQKALQKQL